MNQRRVGAALLLIAALVLVMTKLAGGTTVAGSGARAPLPAPPPIGSCLSGPDYVVGTPLPPQQELEAECWQIASDLLATTDPSYGDRLVIAIRVSTMPGMQGISIIPDAGDSTTESTGEASTVTGSATSVSCLVKAAGAGILAQSLIGNADKPLPIQ